MDTNISLHARAITVAARIVGQHTGYTWVALDIDEITTLSHVHIALSTEGAKQLSVALGSIADDLQTDA